MRGTISAIAWLAASARIAAAAPGVAEEAPVDPPSRFVLGAHVGVGRTADSAEGAAANGYGPWFDAEIGLSVRPWLAILAFAGYASDSANFNGLTNNLTFTHLLAGARVQYAVTPIAWLGAGAAYLRESPSLQDGVVMTNSAKSSPALELRAGFDVARFGRVHFELIADGVVFLPDTHAGFASTIATLSVGAQWR